MHVMESLGEVARLWSSHIPVEEFIYQCRDEWCQVFACSDGYWSIDGHQTFVQRMGVGGWVTSNVNIVQIGGKV